MTEVAIVVGIISILLGAVWVMAEVVWTNYQVNTAQQQMITVVKNMREAYAARGDNNIPFNVANADITAQVDTEGLIPVEMRENRAVAGGNIHHAMSNANAGGTFHITARPVPEANAGRNTFQIQMMNVNDAACAKFLMQLPLDMVEMGAVRLNINNGANTVIINANNVTTPGGATKLPLPVDVAQPFCNGGTNDIRINFKLRV